MLTERLLFKVDPAEFDKDFIQADAEVWTPWLQKQKGFLKKTARVLGKGMVEVLVFWSSKEYVDKAAAKKGEMAMVDSLLKKRSPGRFTMVSSSLSS